MTAPVQSVAQVVAGLVAAYPRVAIEQPTVVAYARALADLDPAGLRDVATRHVATSRFFPTIAELRVAYFDSELGLAPPHEAWAEVEQHIRRHPGGTARPEWTTEAVEAAVAAVGGVAAIRRDERPALVRSQFLKAYAAAAAEAARDANLRSLGAAAGPQTPLAARLRASAALAAIEAAP